MIRAITDQNVAGKRLVVRADLNVPMADRRVTDATRITRFAEGMKPLLTQGASMVVLSHFGRPSGPDPDLSLRLIRDDLSRALARPVRFATLDQAREADLQPGGVLLVENLRFEPGEEANDPALADTLASLGDYYVNDAFSCAHRAHASTHALAQRLPAFAGPLMAGELSALQKALEAPLRPSVAIVGGAKVSTKIAVLRNLVAKVDHLIVGGGMANTFLFARGAPMGRSLHEADQSATVTEILTLAKAAGCTIHLPRDVVVAREFRAGATSDIQPSNNCPNDAMILDAGPGALADFTRVLEGARTILWNGPLGAFEIPPFDAATTGLARVAAELTRGGTAISVAGGGDTVAALNAAGVSDSFTYVSTAGGAFLEWLEGRSLPGVAALMRENEEV
ncbi:phosphoglycerate kinase [Rhodobacter sp. NTK016B]|uniref:phosphoglycerate kinase n=1 Tax=Rhodobacter sp. NTK016B TaxID=2759676 RepID=UPI001A8E7AE0|nr:phosphoglycerate kinase [Rhodobacter sp. NTK016B]MBN8293983.1 phosphoglycerate kinase [Rhodobacter sp. NTK016B]